MVGLNHDPFQHLGREHQEMSSLLRVFDDMLGRLERDEEVIADDLDALVTYFSEVGDMSHHDKEETILVPALIAARMNWYEGPLADMRREHRQERYMMRTLRHSARRVGKWSAEDKRQFVSVGRAFSEFMRQHMSMENEFFKTAALQLSPEQKTKLFEDFERFDKEMHAISDYDNVREQALKLVRSG